MDIGDVVKQTGLPASTLRYYEEKGLIQSIGRKGTKRQFPENILLRLSLIALGQSAGFSLDEIGGMFDPNGKLQIDRQKLKEKAGDLDEAIAQLTAMRDGLLHAADCPATHHLECPKFQQLLKSAGKGRPNSRPLKGKVVL